MSLLTLIEDILKKVIITISDPVLERGDKWNQGELASFNIEVFNDTTYHLKDVTVLLDKVGCTFEKGTDPETGEEFREKKDWILIKHANKENFKARFRANNDVTNVKIWAHVTAEIIPLKGLDGFGLREFTIYEE